MLLKIYECRNSGTGKLFHFEDPSVAQGIVYRTLGVIDMGNNKLLGFDLNWYRVVHCGAVWCWVVRGDGAWRFATVLVGDRWSWVACVVVVGGTGWCWSVWSVCLVAPRVVPDDATGGACLCSGVVERCRLVTDGARCCRARYTWCGQVLGCAG